MKKLLCALTVALASVAGSSPVAAKTVDVTWSSAPLDIDGIVQPYFGTFTIAHDFTNSITDTVIGLLGYTLSFSTTATVVYSYDALVDQFRFGGLLGGAAGASSNTDDFILEFDDFTGADPQFYLFSRTTGTGAVDSTSIGKVSISPIPLPATLPLMLGGLAGLGWVGRCKKKATRPTCA